MTGRVCYLVTYDIADDDRRDDVSLFLSGYGPRVQLSVFEVELPDAQAATAFRERLRALIDPDDDQIRLYRLTRDALAQRLIYGNRTLEERMDFWIILIRTPYLKSIETGRALTWQSQPRCAQGHCPSSFRISRWPGVAALCQPES